MTQEEAFAKLNDLLKRLGSQDQVKEGVEYVHVPFVLLEAFVLAFEENVHDHHRLHDLAITAYNRR